MTVVLRRSTVLSVSTFRVRGRFAMAFNMLLFAYIYQDATRTYSLLCSVSANANSVYMTKPLYSCKYIAPTIKLECNVLFLNICCATIMIAVWTTWLIVLMSGDVQLNPGPIDIDNPLDYSFNSSYSTSTSLSSDIIPQSDVSHHLSFVQCNVKSLCTKIDILRTEFMDFDIIALTETWLGMENSSGDILFQKFQITRKEGQIW